MSLVGYIAVINWRGRHFPVRPARRALPTMAAAIVSYNGGGIS
jgi:hypothetical protein